MLVNPVPACFVNGAGAGAGSGEGEDVGRMVERNDRVETRLDGKLINAQLPAIEAAFAGLPKLARIDFTSTQLQPTTQDSLSQPATPKLPLHSLPLSTQHLLASMLASHARFRSVRPNPNLYTLGHTAAHRHAAATAGSALLTLPDYQFDLLPLPHPHFTSQSAIHSSRIVFHGSPLYNFHSIIRRGLENKSGTKEQTSGAIFGKGIYFSDDLRVARMFSSVSTAWSGSLLGDRLEVVGMYELVMDPVGVRMGEEVVRGGKRRGEEEEVPENYYVVSDNSYCVLRSLLVWRVMDSSKGRNVLRSSWMMIVGYVVLLAVVVLSQVDWKYVRNISRRLVEQYR